MYNYEHEISKTRDKFINNFLFFDYFHDSDLKSIRIENGGEDVFITLGCTRDCPEYEEWSKYVKVTISGDNDDYELHFQNCKHYESNTIFDVHNVVYLNGKFKNSAILKNISKNSRKKYYHFRIEFTSGNFDVVFHKFTIRKIHGDIDVLKNFEYIDHFEQVKKKFRNTEIKEVLELVRNGEWELKPEALEYLWMINHKDCKDIVTMAIQDEDAWMAAVYILGEIGDMSDIAILKRKALELEKYEQLGLLHINDAVQKIFYRI